METIAQILLEKDEIDEAERQFARMFRSGDALGEPIQDWVPCRAILYPSSYAFSYDDEQFDVMVAAAQAVGEDTAYLSSTGWYDGRQISHEYLHTIVQLRKGVGEDVVPKIYADTGNWWYLGVIGTAYYSRNGMWGILTDSEHSIIAGSEAFLDAFGAALDLDRGIPQLLNAMKVAHFRRGADITWLPRLLQHVYGDAKANQFLADADFPIDKGASSGR